MVIEQVKKISRLSSHHPVYVAVSYNPVVTRVILSGRRHVAQRHANRGVSNYCDTVADLDPDWVVSAGFMRILGADFIAAFDQRIINTHPALLPAFPGAHGVRDALAHGVKVTGGTIHLVDSGVDTGPIITQFTVPVLDGDTEDSVHERIKTREREEVVRLLRFLTTHDLTIDGRHVSGYPAAADVVV